MYRSVYDLKSFYNSPPGHMVRRVLGGRIQALWPEVKGLRVMGCGYAVPYLMPFCGEAERVIAMMPTKQGVDWWGKDKGNLVFLSNETDLPIENASMDRILLIHHLEACEDLQGSLREMWRVLKPNGRLMVVVPNRAGFWSRSDWSPFGHGSPFSLTQLCFYLKDNLFVQEQTTSALYVPPLRWGAMMRSAAMFEYIGKSMIPMVGGVHIVEASKQIYAGVDKSGSGSGVLAKTREMLGGKPVAVPQGFSPSRCTKHSKFPEGYPDQRRP